MTFLHTINKDERAMLRTIVKKVHLAYHPERFQTDREADKVISVIGPEVVERMIKFGKDNKVDQL
jgi:ribosomal protein S20